MKIEGLIPLPPFTYMLVKHHWDFASQTMNNDKANLHSPQTNCNKMPKEMPKHKAPKMASSIATSKRWRKKGGGGEQGMNVSFLGEQMAQDPLNDDSQKLIMRKQTTSQTADTKLYRKM